MTTGTPTWSTANKAGLILLGICGLANFVPPPPSDSHMPGPPMPVIVADFILGIIAIAAVIIAFRKKNRGAVWAACAAILLSALSAVPAFFVDGVSHTVRIMVAVFMVVALVGIVLSLSKPKQ
jgi:peptidoglycan/LPS O-acetylase OafA/YrhL